MKIIRVLFLLMLSSQLCGQAWAFTATLRVEEYTDVLIISFPGDAIPAYSVRRTGAQQITATFYEEQGNPLAAVPRLDGASIISEVQPTANGFKLLLKTKAFGYVSAPVPGHAQLEVHVFSDPVGTRWVDMSRENLSLSTPKAKTAGVRPPGINTALKAPPAKVAKPTEARALPTPVGAALAVVPSTPPPQDLPESTEHAAGSPQVTDTAKPGADAAATTPGEAAPPPAAPPASVVVAPPPSALLPAPEVRALSLREALSMALENNPRILASQGRAASAELNIPSARGALFPHAQMSYGWSKIANPNNTSETNSDYINKSSRTYNLQIQQNIFDGLMRFSNLSRVKLISARQEQDRRKVELDTIESVQREYFKLIRTRSDIKTFTSSVARLKNQKEAANAFYRLEMAPRLTVLQVETALAQTEQRLSKALSDEQIQLVKLQALLGQPGLSNLDFKGDLMKYVYDLQLDFGDCVRKAQTILPEAIIANTDVEIAQEELNFAQGKIYPKLDATTSFIQQSTSYPNGAPSTDRKYYTAGLNVTWEIFSGGEQYYEIQSKKKLLRAANDDLASTMLAVYSYVRESYLNVGEAKNQIRIAMLRRKEANEAYEQASTRFRSGIGTNIDVLDAHEKTTAADAAFNQAQADFLTSLASLYRSMGEKDLNLAMLSGADSAR